MDLRAVKAATGPELAAAAAATARNAEDLVRDAEVLAQVQSTARAYSLAALAVEEVGKEAALFAMAGMPDALKARMPVRRMLEWHQYKQAKGQLIAALPPYGPRGLARRLLATSAADLAQVLTAMEVPAEQADRLKRGGFYVDICRDGGIREPSQITEAEVTSQLGRARLAVIRAKTLFDLDEPAELVKPSTEGIELARAAVESFAAAGYARTPDAAIDVITHMVCTLWERMTGSSACGVLAA